MWPGCVLRARERRGNSAQGLGGTSSPSTTIPKNTGCTCRTSNPIESIFSGVRLRTNAARRIRSRENALYLVFKLVERLSGNWRVLNGGENLMALVLAGCGFEDGILKRGQVYGMATAAD